MAKATVSEQQFASGGLPPVCVKTGEATRHRESVSARVGPGWLPLLAVPLILPYFLLRGRFSRKVEGYLPMAEDLRDLQRRQFRDLATTAIAGILAIVGGLFVRVDFAQVALVGVGLLVAVGAAFVLAGWYRETRVIFSPAEEGQITIKRVHNQFRVAAEAGVLAGVTAVHMPDAVTSEAISESHTPDGHIQDGHIPDGDIQDGDIQDGHIPDGDIQDGEPVDDLVAAEVAVSGSGEPSTVSERLAHTDISRDAVATTDDGSPRLPLIPRRRGISGPIADILHRSVAAGGAAAHGFEAPDGPTPEPLEELPPTAPAYAEDVPADHELTNVSAADRPAEDVPADIELAGDEQAEGVPADVELADVVQADAELAGIEQTNLEQAFLEQANLEQADVEQASLELADLELAEVVAQDVVHTEDVPLEDVLADAVHSEEPSAEGVPIETDQIETDHIETDHVETDHIETDHVDDPTQPATVELTVETPPDLDIPFDESAALNAALEALAIEEPAQQKPAVEPAAEAPTTEEPDHEIAFAAPLAQEPAIEDPVTEEPAAEEPAREITFDLPAADEPAALDITIDAPTEDQPATQEPAAEEPTVAAARWELDPIEPAPMGADLETVSDGFAADGDTRDEGSVDDRVDVDALESLSALLGTASASTFAATPDHEEEPEAAATVGESVVQPGTFDVPEPIEVGEPSPADDLPALAEAAAPAKPAATEEAAAAVEIEPLAEPAPSLSAVLGAFLAPNDPGAPDAEEPADPDHPTLPAAEADRLAEDSLAAAGDPRSVSEETLTSAASHAGEDPSDPAPPEQAPRTDQTIRDVLTRAASGASAPPAPMPSGSVAGPSPTPPPAPHGAPSPSAPPVPPEPTQGGNGHHPPSVATAPPGEPMVPLERRVIDWIDLVPPPASPVPVAAEPGGGPADEPAERPTDHTG